MEMYFDSGPEKKKDPLGCPKVQVCRWIFSYTHDLMSFAATILSEDPTGSHSTEIQAAHF